MSAVLTEDEILREAGRLPAFPGVVSDILATLEDDNATLGALTQLVQRDPVITARVLSLASAASTGAHWHSGVRDMQVAVSMIGLSRVREIVLGLSLAEFARSARARSHYWEHSVAVGIAAQEVARHAHAPVDLALVAGLLHDIGQLWMALLRPADFQRVLLARAHQRVPVTEIEREFFGIDHARIGAILATGWGLPPAIVRGIAHHHDGEVGDDRVAAATHLGEVLVTVLELGPSDDRRIHVLSETAVETLGIDWESDLNFLFGRIESRAQLLGDVFRT